MTSPSPKPTEIAKPTELTVALCEPDEMDVEGMITMDTIERCPACKAVCGNNPLPSDPNHPHNPCKYHFQVRCYSCDYRAPVKSADDQEMAYNSAARAHNALCAPALAPFEKLVEELRAEAEQTRTHHGGGTFRLTGRQRPTWSELSDEGELLLKCADRLSAVVEEVRGK